MKRIGIITYHHHSNYGTMLQAYALQHQVAAMGYESELIDYTQSDAISALEMLKLRIKRLPVYIREFKKYRTLAVHKEDFAQKHAKFEMFYEKYLRISNTHYTQLQQLMDDPPVYNGYLVGSDQTWNPFMAKSLEAFFLPFVKDNRAKGCYAPSVAVNTLTADQERMYKENLANFAFLSCREKDGAELLQKITGKPVEHVLDPTLLLDRDQWMEHSTYKAPDKPYILAYFLGEKAWHREAVEQLRKQTGWDVITLPAAFYEMDNPQYEQVWGGPEEFLALIDGAKLICTDSFHGTIFAMNFQKNFYTFCKTDDTDGSSENSRLYSVLEQMNLSDRIVKKGCVPALEEIDYQEPYARLQEARVRSLAYLKNMLEEITKE